MKKDELEKQYREITSLYNMADDLTSTVEDKSIKNPDEQLSLIEPLINEIAESADVLSEEYIALLEKPTRKKMSKVRVEAALRKIFLALEAYRQRLSELTKTTVMALANIADPIVDKIRKQTERITLIFMQLLEISLDKIMRKYELDEFKRANQVIVGSMIQI